jgi:CHASE3 domain sensor protein
MERAHIITQEEKYLEDARVALKEYYIRQKEARQSESREDRAEYLKLAEEANREYVKVYNKYLELGKVGGKTR